MSVEKLKLLVLDVDGVLNDGRLYFGPTGEELKPFHARDGAGIKYLMESGVECAFMSGRDSEALHRRVENLGVKHLVAGISDKRAEFRKLAASLGLAAEEVGYVGDDLLDVPTLRAAGWSACPSDAVEQAREAADYVAGFPGGAGAVREIAEHVLKAQGKWAAVLARYRGE